MNWSLFAPFPDLSALSLTLCLTFLLSIGIKESIKINTLFAMFAIFLVGLTVIAGIPYVNFGYWDLPADPEKGTEGGFFPYGVSGMMKGAAICFFAFVGLDGITTSGEEVKDPRKSIPLATMIALLMINTAYICICVITTLLVSESTRPTNHT